MRSTTRLLAAVGLMALIVLFVRARPARDAVADQTRKPVTITRLYTGADGQTHSEDMEVTLSGNPLNEVSEMLKVSGAEIHRAPPGKVSTWHTAPRRQYVITISGRGEIELAGGKKIELGPGHIELAEDVTGKGHITRVVGNEDRVTIQMPLADQGVH
jgi:hypothetical protein